MKVEYKRYLLEAGHPQRIVDLAKECDRLYQENKILRVLSWLNHGHIGLYGDDGEMQCSECFQEHGFWDWKRTPASEIQEKMYAAAANLMDKGMNVAPMRKLIIGRKQ